MAQSRHSRMPTGKIFPVVAECKALMKDRRNRPVVISQSKDRDFPVWKVEYGFSCVLFGSYEEAMAFCHGLFTR